VGDRYDEFINFEQTSHRSQRKEPLNESLDPSTFVETSEETFVDTRKQSFRGGINESLDNRYISSIDKEISSKEDIKKDELSLGEPLKQEKKKPKEQDFELASSLKQHFNEMFEGTSVPKIVKLDKKRFAPVLVRASEYGRESILKVLQAVRESSFLMGDNDRGWTADFDWIFKPTNFVKILEGKYGNSHATSKRDRVADEAIRRVNDGWKELDERWRSGEVMDEFSAQPF
jgi:hypothetical protein